MDEFKIKNTEMGYTMTLVYDRWGGMRIMKQDITDYGTKKYQEIYLPKDAMMQLANNILKTEMAKA